MTEEQADAITEGLEKALDAYLDDFMADGGTLATLDTNSLAEWLILSVKAKIL